MQIKTLGLIYFDDIPAILPDLKKGCQVHCKYGNVYFWVNKMKIRFVPKRNFL